MKKKLQNRVISRIKENKLFLVGSITKAQDYFIKIESILQIIYKKIVSICSVDGLLNKDKFSKDEWEDLQQIALKKLQDQEALLVLDIDGYIGDQSNEEIQYFERKLNRPIYFLSELRRDYNKL